MNRIGWISRPSELSQSDLQHMSFLMQEAGIETVIVTGPFVEGAITETVESIETAGLRACVILCPQDTGRSKMRDTAVASIRKELGVGPWRPDDERARQIGPGTFLIGADSWPDLSSGEGDSFRIIPSELGNCAELRSQNRETIIKRCRDLAQLEANKLRERLRATTPFIGIKRIVVALGVLADERLAIDQNSGKSAPKTLLPWMISNVSMTVIREEALNNTHIEFHVLCGGPSTGISFTEGNITVTTAGSRVESIDVI